MDFVIQVKGAGPAMDQLADAKDQLKALNRQLTESETKCAQYEAEVRIVIRAIHKRTQLHNTLLCRMIR